MLKMQASHHPKERPQQEGTEGVIDLGCQIRCKGCKLVSYTVRVEAVEHQGFTGGRGGHVRGGQYGSMPHPSLKHLYPVARRELRSSRRVGIDLNLCHRE